MKNIVSMGAGGQWGHLKNKKTVGGEAAVEFK